MLNIMYCKVSVMIFLVFFFKLLKTEKNVLFVKKKIFFSDSVKKIITTSVDKSKLDNLFQKNLKETKEELKKINS